MTGLPGRTAMRWSLGGGAAVLALGLGVFAWFLITSTPTEPAGTVMNAPTANAVPASPEPITADERLDSRSEDVTASRRDSPEVAPERSHEPTPELTHYTREVHFLIDGEPEFPDSLRFHRMTGEDAREYDLDSDPWLQAFEARGLWIDRRTSSPGVWRADVEWQPGPPEVLTFLTSGFLPAVVRAPIPPRAGETIVVEVPLVRAGVVDGEVLAPLTTDSFQVVLQRHHEDSAVVVSRSRWMPAWRVPPGGAAAPFSSDRPRRVIRFSPLEAGRYRLYDQVSGKVGEEFDLQLGDIRRTTLDLRRSGIIRGRIILPTGYRYGDARLIIEHADGRQRGQSLDLADGTFAFRVPGDEPLTLRATHPALSPDPGTDGIVVQSLRDDVVLRMIEARTMVFEIGEFPLPEPPGTARMHLVPLGDDGTRLAADQEATVTLSVPLTDRVGRAGDPPTGRYDLCLDLHGAAPLWLSDVRIEDAALDLGRLDFESGATLSVELRRHGQTVDVPVRLFLERTHGPRFWRSVRDDSSQASISGLGPGRYTLSLNAERQTFRRDVQVGEGERTVLVTVDLGRGDGGR